MNRPAAESADLWNVLADHLESLQRAGLSHVSAEALRLLKVPAATVPAAGRRIEEVPLRREPPPARPIPADAGPNIASPNTADPAAPEPLRPLPQPQVPGPPAGRPRSGSLMSDMPSFLKGDLAPPRQVPGPPGAPVRPQERRGSERQEPSQPAKPAGKPFPGGAQESPPRPRPYPEEPSRNQAARPGAGARAPSEGRGLFEEPPPPSLSQPQRVEALRVLATEIRGCTKCPELVRNRSRTVFGVGPPQPRLCFFGEAPGAEEDRQGEPFVGPAGQLLDKMIAACTLRREDVFILNVLKCRPPENRAPLPAEIDCCRPHFERQFAILQPEFICCLGATAAQALLDTTVSIGRLRGKLHRKYGATVICTYHPSYLLRYPPAKKDAWDDLQFLMREMGLDRKQDAP